MAGAIGALKRSRGAAVPSGIRSLEPPGHGANTEDVPRDSNELAAAAGGAAWGRGSGSVEWGGLKVCAPRAPAEERVRLGHGDGVGKLALRTVGESDGNHVSAPAWVAPVIRDKNGHKKTRASRVFSLHDEYRESD